MSENPFQTPEAELKTDVSNERYQTYDQVPFYNKQWFFWIMYFTLTPVALGILIFSNVYYKKKGQVVKFGLANKIVAGLIALLFISRIYGALTSGIF